MSPTSTTRASLVRLVAAGNREIAFEAAIELTTGVAYCLVVFGLVFVILWVQLSLITLRVAGQAWWIALAVAGLFFLVSFFEAWRRVDPFEGVRRLEDWQVVLTEMSLLSPSLLYFSPRHASAGLAFVLISGPQNLISAVASWRTRLPSEPHVLDAAAALLESAPRRPRADRVESPASAVLLHRLGLIKARPGADAPAIEPTQKGLDVLAGRSSGVLDDERAS